VFHVHDNRRAQRSAELLWEALRGLLAEKPLSDISVSDLQRESGIARTTFYRSFDDVADILAWKFDEGLKEALGSGTADSMPERKRAERYFAYWAAHPETLEILLENGREDMIFACHMLEAARLVAHKPERTGSVPPRIAAGLRYGALAGILLAWLEGGRKESTPELLFLVDQELTRLAREMA